MENTITTPIAYSLFKTKYSLAIRIWHWLTFVTITASVLLVLFASTLFSIKGNVTMVQEQVQQKGGVVTSDQARAVAHEYSDKLWMLHKYIGFGLCFLLLCRMVLEIIFSKEARLVSKIRKAAAFQTQTQDEKLDRLHYILVKWGYVLFYTLFLVMALTGLGLAFEDVPLFRANHKLIVTIHSFVQYLLYLYILFHIAGVIRADTTANKGIVSSMINGG